MKGSVFTATKPAPSMKRSVFGCQASNKQHLLGIIRKKPGPHKGRKIPLSLYPLATRPSRSNDSKHRARSQKESTRNQLTRKRLHKWRMQNGMSKTGRLNESTRVFFSCIPPGRGFCSHQIFPKTPNQTLRQISKEHWKKWKSIEREVGQSIEQKALRRKTAQGHLNVNLGVQLGMSVVSGGRGSNTIQWGAFMKNRPHLRKRMCGVLRDMMEDTFGGCWWYRRLLELVQKLNLQSREDRTLPGIPCTGIWYTTLTKNEGIHCDNNVVGATFLFSTQRVQGGTVNLQQPSGNYASRKLETSWCLAGRWAENAHCNTEVDDKTALRRRSLVLYLDRAAFTAAYKLRKPVGFQE